MTIEDSFRVINLLVISVCLIQSITLKNWWLSNRKELRLILITIPILMLTIAYGTIEAIIQDVGFGGRVLLYTPSLILVMISFSLMKKKVKAVEKLRKDVQNGRNP